MKLIKDILGKLTWLEMKKILAMRCIIWNLLAKELCMMRPRSPSRIGKNFSTMGNAGFLSSSISNSNALSTLLSPRRPERMYCSF